MSDTGYAGRDDIATDSTDFSVMAFVIDQIISRNSHVAWVKVVAVRDGTVAVPATVDALPMVNMLDGQGQPVAHGMLYGLPVVAWQAGTNAIVAAPAVGDVGIALFADRDVSIAKVTKTISNPGTRRRYDMSDGIYLGSILGPAATQYVLMDAAGITMVSPVKVTVQAPEINLDGVFKINGDDYLDHVHTDVTEGSDDSGGVL